MRVMLLGRNGKVGSVLGPALEEARHELVESLDDADAAVDFTRPDAVEENVRAALESGVPVVPVVLHGSQRIRNWKRLQLFPKVTVRYGEPISFDVVPEPTREQQVACAEEVFSEVRRMYAELELEGRSSVMKRVGPPAPRA